MLVCFISYYLCLTKIHLGDHALYLSPIKMKIEERHLIAEIHIFEDDLRDALRHYSHSSALDWPGLEKYAKDYMSAHFIIRSDEQLISLDFEISPIDTEVMSVKCRTDLPDNYKALSIEADYLMELFPLQKNILHLTTIMGDDVSDRHQIFDLSHRIHRFY